VIQLPEVNTAKLPTPMTSNVECYGKI